ncbi:MAG: COQ9 family protein [Parvularculaceae bacterium]|nr:COQ9 family protein [Parvularculaceae bacterium]
MSQSEDAFEPVREAILAEALKGAAFDGFTPLSLARATADAGRSKAELAAAFPRGPIDLVIWWSKEADAAAAAAIAAPQEPPLKIREKVSKALEARLAYLRSDKEAARRAAAFLALPHHAPTGARLVWQTADAVWRAMGDPSTDFNFYSKRAILSGVWSTTFARWLADDSEDEAATKAFLAARIDNVMQFEKLKTRVKDSGFDPEGMFGWLAKMRYPER